MTLGLPPGRDDPEDTAVVPYTESRDIVPANMDDETDFIPEPSYGDNHDQMRDDRIASEAERKRQEREAERQRREDEKYARDIEDLQEKYEKDMASTRYNETDRDQRHREVEYTGSLLKKEKLEQAREAKRLKKDAQREDQRLKKEQARKDKADKKRDAADMRAAKARAAKAQAASDAAERIARQQEDREKGRTAKDFKDMAARNRGKKPYAPAKPLNFEGLKMAAAERGIKRVRDVPKVAAVGTFSVIKNVSRGAAEALVGNQRHTISDGHGRSGRRATKAYRQANRQFNSEARRLRSQVKSIGSVNSIMMFGRDTMPTRSRYKAGHEFGGKLQDPLSNLTSTVMGMPAMRQDTIVEASVRREMRPPRRSKQPQSDALTRFLRVI